MAYKAAIFDLDGTLVNSLADLTDAMNYALKVLGQPTWDQPAYRKMIGNSTNLLIKRALGPDKQNLFDEMSKILSEKYAQICLNKTGPYEGIPETIDELHKRDIKLAVLTNKGQKMAARITTHLFGKNLFDEIIGSTTGNPIKPDPTQTLQLLDRWEVKSQKAVFIGDSDVDMQTAKACRMLAVGVSWGFRPVEELKASGADVIINTPAELINLFI